MPPTHKSLQGKIILDGGKLHGSFFHRSVVLICQHDPEGAFGLILNRATENKVGQAMVANLPKTIKEQTLFIGGPVQPQTLSFLHTDAFLPNANVMSNLSLGHSIETLVDVGESFSGTQQIRLYAGYAGWSPGQLDMEISRHDWLIIPATIEMVFHPDPPQLWKGIMKQQDMPARLLADAPDDLAWN